MILKPHPIYTEYPLIIKAKSSWKLKDDDDFLDEFNFAFDLTPLLEKIEQTEIWMKPENTIFDKAERLSKAINLRDIKVEVDDKNLTWSMIPKKNGIVIINNLTEASKIIFNERLLPRKDDNLNDDNGVQVEKPHLTVYVLKDTDQNLIDKLMPGHHIIEIESFSSVKLLNNEWIETNYNLTLNYYRTQLGLTMANSVPLPGYYSFHTLRLDKPGKNPNDENENAIYDLPHQFIGLGHWLPLDIETIIFKKHFNIEVRLNPLFNKNAIITGLDPNFPRNKHWEVFYNIMSKTIIKVNTIKFNAIDSAYAFDWKVIPLFENVKIEKILNNCLNFWF